MLSSQSKKTSSTIPSGVEAKFREMKAEMEEMEAPYSVEGFLGSGSYGTVWVGKVKPQRVTTGGNTSAKNAKASRLTQSGAATVSPGGEGEELVAVKRVSSTFNGEVVLESPFLALRTLREFVILSNIRHPHVLALRDVHIRDTLPQLLSSGGGSGLKSSNSGSEKLSRTSNLSAVAAKRKPKLYLVTEKLDVDLAHLVKDPYSDISLPRVRQLMYQTLLGLHALHTMGVAHRDLHPGNLMLDANGKVKICDFNLARKSREYRPNPGGPDAPDSDAKTHYVTLRWYRAPELAMQFDRYDVAVDMWSAGCVLAELLNRKPLLPGKSYVDQLVKIIELVGTPPNLDDIRPFSTPASIDYIKQHLSGIRPRPWRAVVCCSDDRALHLLSRLLTFDPRKRITALEALRHPFFAPIFNEEDIVVAERASQPSIFELVEAELSSIESIQAALVEAVQFYRGRKNQQSNGCLDSPGLTSDTAKGVQRGQWGAFLPSLSAQSFSTAGDPSNNSFFLTPGLRSVFSTGESLPHPENDGHPPSSHQLLQSFAGPAAPIAAVTREGATPLGQSITSVDLNPTGNGTAAAAAPSMGSNNHSIVTPGTVTHQLSFSSCGNSFAAPAEEGKAADTSQMDGTATQRNLEEKPSSTGEPQPDPERRLTFDDAPQSSATTSCTTTEAGLSAGEHVGHGAASPKEETLDSNAAEGEDDEEDTEMEGRPVDDPQQRMSLSSFRSFECPRANSIPLGSTRLIQRREKQEQQRQFAQGVHPGPSTVLQPQARKPRGDCVVS
jgi:mitogen-activated protein kinase 1/3